jgi:hypothetical protein
VRQAPIWLLNACNALDFLTIEHLKVMSTLPLRQLGLHPWLWFKHRLHAFRPSTRYKTPQGRQAGVRQSYNVSQTPSLPSSTKNSRRASSSSSYETGRVTVINNLLVPSFFATHSSFSRGQSRNLLLRFSWTTLAQAVATRPSQREITVDNVRLSIPTLAAHPL